MFARIRRVLSETVEETPGMVIAVLGLGMCITSRMVRLQVSNSAFPTVDTMVWSGAVLSVCLLVLTLAYRRAPGMCLYRYPVVALLVAASSSVALVAASLLGGQTVGGVLTLVVETVPLVCSDLMLLMWGGALLAYGLRRLLLIFSLASCVAALATLMLGAIKPEVECGAVAMLPMLGVVCLYFFLEYNTSRNGFVVGTRSHGGDLRVGVSGGTASDAGGIDGRAGVACTAAPMGALVFLFFFLVRFCLAFATVGWIGSSPGQGASAASQVASMLGMVLAGVVALVVAVYCWNPAGLVAYPFALLFMLLCALFMTSAAQGRMALAAVAFVNMVQATLFALALALPHLADRAGECGGMGASAGALLACSLGTTCASIGFKCLPSAVFALLVGCALLVLGAAFMAFIVRSNDAEGPAGADSTGCWEAAVRMARAYGLTPRESDIFVLMAQRYASAEIAEALVVSMATVRTHVRNIYAKLDVHSAKEFHALVGANLCRTRTVGNAGDQVENGV